MAKVLLRPRLAASRDRSAPPRPHCRAVLLGLLAVSAGCAPSSTTAAEITPQLTTWASLEGGAGGPAERASKAKANALATRKDSATIASTGEPQSDQATALYSASSERCPSEMALVDGRVCVDRWEASLVERTPEGERPWSPFVAVDGHERRVRAVSAPGVVPQGYISGRQAKMACAASGKRLCTADEWVTACRGPEDTMFPYGPVRLRGACNDDERRVHPVAELGAQLDVKPEEIWTTVMNNPRINQLSEALLPTGERAGCTNAYDVFDMVGNLHEWIDDPTGTFRGGYFMDTTRNGEGCKYATTAHSFTYHDYSTGFRCCMDPEHAE